MVQGWKKPKTSTGYDLDGGWSKVPKSHYEEKPAKRNLSQNFYHSDHMDATQLITKTPDFRS